jgi:hypothetical protein
MTKTSRLPLLLAVLCCLAGAAAVAHAVSTRLFSLDSASALSAGKLDGTAVTSTGTVIAGVTTERLSLENVAVARCLVTAADGTSYVGTGNAGKVFRLKGDKLESFADTGELMVASLALAADGGLYAGTLPKGKIFRIDAAGKATLFAQPEGAEHVWALVLDEAKKTLFAATGPQGKLFAIDAKGKPEIYYDSEAAHLMALVRDSDGSLYVGTSDDALLVHVRGAGRAEVVHDFEGNELTALDLRDGVLAVAANVFSKATPTVPKKSGSDDKSDSEDKTDAKIEPPKPGKGSLWRVDKAGRAERVFESDQGHITAVQWGPGGVIYAATGKEGHIYRVESSGEHALWVDVDERQVLALDLAGKRPLFVTADGAAVYKVLPGPAREALWTSKVLDAQFQSRWGQLSWRGEGKLRFQTRSGNTEKPDATWTDWSGELTSAGPIRSPAGRFLQVRVRLGAEPGTVIYAIKAYYLPANQPVTLRELSAAPKPPSSTPAASKPGSDGSVVPVASSVYAIKWKAENPDGDRLRYRLRYRPEAGKTLRTILQETEVLTEDHYDWATDSIADGYYRIEVAVSDELENPGGRALDTRLLSEPVLIDNHAPRVLELRYDAGKGVVSGVAEDQLGPITQLEFNIDGQKWQPSYPTDDLFDTAREPFQITLPKLAAGEHVIAVRALDARHNLGSAELEITAK